MKSATLLKKDLEAVADRFPKLKWQRNGKLKRSYLVGELDICDAVGEYWGTFEIEILIPENYPFGVPKVWETSKIIPREANRHISPSGECCLDMEHRLLQTARKGICINKFIADKVYPYFANQLYFKEKQRFAGGEYAHAFEGVRQFYAEDLKLEKPTIIVQFLESILSNELPGRNAMCPCGSKEKYKRCHMYSIDILKAVGKDKLTEDLRSFSKLAVEDK